MRDRLKAYAPQAIRRLIQLSSLAFVIYAAMGAPWRNFKHAHNSRRLVGLMEGDTWAWLYGTNEDMLALLGEPFEASLGFLGLHWASTVFGVEVTDPVLGLAQIVSTLSLPMGLLAGLIGPLLLALVAGKIFCSHLCPMRLLFELAQGARTGLLRLGVSLPEWRSKTRLGGWVLLGGLLATFFGSMIVWVFILPYLSLAAGIYMLVFTGSISGVVGAAVFWLLVDMLVAPGFFCHNLCPTGFVLEQVGRFKPIALRHKAGADPCPDGCRACTKACPYNLSPKMQTHTSACDSCAKCTVACPLQKLTRNVALPTARGPRPKAPQRPSTLPAALMIAAVLLPALSAEAHHNKGLPHYGYYENYPQVPTEEYVVIDDQFEMGATVFNFQGLERADADTPNDVKIYLYIYDLKNDLPYHKAVDFEIRKDGEVIASYLRRSVDEESIYATRETMPESGDYELVAYLPTEPPTTLILPFHVDLSSDGISLGVLAAIFLPVLALFALAYSGRRKRRRRKKSGRPRAAAATLSGLLALCLTRVAAALTPASAPATMPMSSPSSAPASAASTMQHYDTAEGTVMVMGGIPLWLFLVGVVGIIVVSFVGVEWIGSNPGKGFRFNLVKNKRVYDVMRSRWLQAIPQILAVAALGFLIYAGLFGSRVANVTPVAVWTVWWAGLIFAVLFLGSAFCFACPWDGLTNLMTRLRVAAKVEPLSLGAEFPMWLRNVYPAIGLFVVLTWLELGYGVTTDPRTTAYMGLGVAGMAAAGALLWGGKRFCHHVCPVGRISGIYANFSPIEIRARNPNVCAKCKTEDCLHGNEKGYACPTGILLKDNPPATYCTMCTECFKSCNKRNVALNLRPFGADLRSLPTGRMDEAWLALTLLTLTLFHGLSMTPAWENFEPGGQSLLKWMSVSFGMSHTANFTAAMVLVCLIPVALYWLSCRIGAAWAGDKSIGGRALFVNYAFSLLPVALFYHLAHNAMHLFMEGGELVPLLGDPLGRGDNILGLADVHVGPLMDEGTLWAMQVVLILIGHLFGIVVAHRAGHKLYSDKRAAVRSLVPMLVVMVLISVAGLGLMHLDMNMRIGRM